jgi:ribosomal protein S18 acetylase RimI-like enzyme
MLNPALIRLADVHDAVPIATMSRDLIEQGLGWSWTPPRVRQSIADAQTNVVVVPGSGGELQAFAIMRYRDDDAHPERVRQGIGSALMAWLEKVAMTAGVDRISLEARVTNIAARAFYARLGYLESQLRPGYYAGREASVCMAKDLWLDRPQRA